MGKGRVIATLGEGRYTIELIEDRLRAASSRASAVARIAAIDARLVALEENFAAAQQIVDQAAAEQDAAIDQYQADLAEEGESEVDLATFAAALLEAAGKRDAIRSQINQLKVERLALQSRIERVDALPALRQVDAWCADLTEDLAGDVGTAEVPGEAKQVLVHPGHDGAAAYNQARDGALQPALSGTPAGVLYNLAMLPGWQKWRPTYRIATITDLSTSADTCAIDIAPATSSQQGLNVNAEASYAGVPIQYMTCNASAFEVGDRVLVRFDRQDQSPTVIGFESEPRGCGIDTVVAIRVDLYYNVTFPFLTGPCACGYPIPPGSTFTSRAAKDYFWRMDMSQGVRVFEKGKLAAALQASDHEGFPQEDHLITEDHDVRAPFRVTTKYTYAFPAGFSIDECTTEDDEFSHVAVTNDSAFIGDQAPFFNGELAVRDSDYTEITLEDEQFQVSYEPWLIQREWESTGYGIATVAGGEGSCTAGFLLSKDRESVPGYSFQFPLNLTGVSAPRRLPPLTIGGQAKRPLGVFHMIPGEMDWLFDPEVIVVDGATRVLDARFEGAQYLLVGYGR